MRYTLLELGHFLGELIMVPKGNREVAQLIILIYGQNLGLSSKFWSSSNVCTYEPANPVPISLKMINDEHLTARISVHPRGSNLLSGRTPHIRNFNVALFKWTVYKPEP